MKDDRSRALAVLVALFLIGVLLGGAGSYLWLKSSADTEKRVDRRFPSPMGGRPNGPMTGPPNGSPTGQPSPKPPELDLTSEQQEKIQAIWNETKEKFHALGQALGQEQQKLMTEGEKKRNEIWAENDRNVQAILNEEQRAKFDPWLEEFSAWRKQWPRRGPDRGPGRGQERPKENFQKPKSKRL